MKKSLTELKKDDWNRLFPVELVDHNPEWKNIFAAEKQRILSKIGKEKILRIEHFGSTAISSIKSKPYIDIIIEIPKELLFNKELIDEFSALGYSHFKVPSRENIAEYSTFGKGYNIDGKNEQIFHIHMCPKDNAMWAQIDFRDYLNSNNKRAKEYEDLKLELASKFRNDRGSYVLGKTSFINETINLATKKMTTFPVIASTLSAKQLGDFVKDRYGLDDKYNCTLFRTGMNHTYFLSNTETKYVLRVYSHNWRSKTEIIEELELLKSLKNKNLSVSFPIEDKDGAFIQEINAPEGIRYVVLFSFAQGEKIRFMDKETCFRIGVLMANMHNHTENKNINRVSYHKTSLIELPYAYLKQFFSDNLPEMEFIREFGENFQNSDFDNTKTGIIHMDIWYDNMAVTAEKEITIFDFDFCGNGWQILDVGYFCKQLFFIESDKEQYELKMQSFLRGYQSNRFLSEKELSLIPKAGASIFIFYLGIQAQRFDWSNIFLTENYLKMFVGRIKVWMDYYTKNEITGAI